MAKTTLISRIKAIVKEASATIVQLTGVLTVLGILLNGVGDTILKVGSVWHEVKHSADVVEMSSDIATVFVAGSTFLFAHIGALLITLTVVVVTAVARWFLVSKPREQLKSAYERERKNKIGDAG